MAELERDRAQMLLVGALLLAVVVIALAVIANAAIFTGNLASRSPGSSGADALELRHEVEQSTGGLVTNVNANTYSDYLTREAALENGIETQDEGLGYHSASTGKSVLTSHGSHTRGIRIEDESPGGSEFGSADSSTGGGSADWDVATSVTDARAFRFEVDRSSLSGDTAADGDWSDQFIVQIAPSSGGSPQWSVHFGEDGSGNAIVNVTRGSAGSVVPVGECDLSGGTATVDVTRGTADGRPCEPLDEMWFGPDAIAPAYDIRFENGDAARGNYSLVVDDGAATPAASSRTSDGPASYLAIYEAVVDYRYNSPTVTYATEIRVAPGEPDD